MVNENYVRVGGGLTRAPHVTATKNGSQMVAVTVAVNGTRWDGQAKEQVVTTEYVSVVAFGGMAEQMLDLGLDRGDVVVVEGALSQQEVENKDGTKERKTRVAPWSVRLVNKRQRQAQRPPVSDGWGPIEEPPF